MATKGLLPDNFNFNNRNLQAAYLILNCQLSYFAIQMNITFAVQVVYSKEQKHTVYNALFD